MPPKWRLAAQIAVSGLPRTPALTMQLHERCMQLKLSSRAKSQLDSFFKLGLEKENGMKRCEERLSCGGSSAAAAKTRRQQQLLQKTICNGACGSEI